MNNFLQYFPVCALCLSASFAEEDIKVILTEEVTYKQDYLSGDIQELVELQTKEEVIQKLEKVEASMVEATLKLLDGDTSGETIAIQTEIIENAYEAAKAKQKSQSSQSGTDKALMDMLEKMLGKEGQEGGEPTESSGEKEGAGKPQVGDGNPESASANTSPSTLPTGSRRTVPSAAPTPGQLLPAEFQDIINDYNKAGNL